MNITKFLEDTVYEDIGRGDLYSRVNDYSKSIKSYVIAKSDGVFAGREYIDELAKMYNLRLDWQTTDGDIFENQKILLWISGNDKTILMLERTILNIILHASSIATNTAKYVQLLNNTKTKLLDTRKTRPHLREFEKYAVRCGGGINHRMGLDDALMIKDTHLKTITNLKFFIDKARLKIPFTSKIEVECENINMVQIAMDAGADIIMCDNMTPEQIKEVVTYRDLNYPHILLEASGNIDFHTIQEYASSGVDAISSGALIHQANWIDISMRVEA